MSNDLARRETTALEVRTDSAIESRVVESVITRGDISDLKPAERARYYLQLCESLGLSAAAQPFTPLKLNGKEILYASRGATDQLAARHGINREIVDGPKLIDVAGTKMIYAVCRATHPNGRSETAVATVPAQDLINALMKCETKAKRRATLSILGLGMLDETEIETIPAHVRSEAPPIESTKSKRALTDEEKRTLAAPILADYDAGIARGENADALHETAKVQAREAGVATFVQQELARRASEDAARKRAAWAADVLDRLLSALDSADGVPAAIVGAWLDVSEDVRRLDKAAQDHAWAQVESAWTAAGAPSGLREAVAVEKSKRAK